MALNFSQCVAKISVNLKTLLFPFEILHEENFNILVMMQRMHYKNIKTNGYVVSVSVRVLPKRVDWEFKLILRKVLEKVTRT